jgi:hypothetical protein
VQAGTKAGAGDLVPTFISERDRPKTEQGRLNDFRMCPKCFGGYYINMYCSELGMHQGERSSGSQVQNVCRDCGFFSREWSEWPRADELLKANKMKAQLPYLHGTITAITAIQSCLSRYFSPNDAPHTAQLFHQPALQVSYGSCLGRRFIRQCMINSLRVLVAAALERLNRTVNCSLQELGSDGKHAVLLLQLMRISECFVTPFLNSVGFLRGCNPHSDPHIVSVVLLCHGAVQAWDAPSLDNFIAGNLGTMSSAPALINYLLDIAAHTLIARLPQGYPYHKMGQMVFNYNYLFKKISCHELFVWDRALLQLYDSLLFCSLGFKFGLSQSDVVVYLLRHVPFKQALHLVTAAKVVPFASALLPLLIPSHFSFGIGCAVRAQSDATTSSVEADVAAAAVSAIFNSHPTRTSHSTFAWFDQARSVEYVM